MNKFVGTGIDNILGNRTKAIKVIEFRVPDIRLFLFFFLLLHENDEMLFPDFSTATTT